MSETAMESAKNMAKDYKEASRKRQIDFLRTHYNKAIVDAAIAYADSEISQRHLYSYPHDSVMLEMAKAKAIEAGQQEVADFIEMQMEFDTQDIFNVLTFAYVHGMSFGISNPNIGKTPEPVTDYVLSKDFAFIFDYSDNDFGIPIEQAAKEYCKEYNNLLRQIELYSSISDGDGDLMVESYKKDLEFMEDPNTVRQLMKAAFIGEYMTNAIDRCWVCSNKPFNAMERLNKAQDLANNYFNFETNTNYNVDNTDRVNWKFGTWDEVSKFGLEKYKGQQGEDDLKKANGDFTKYWLNGEVLIVRMVDGKLVAETH